MDAQTSEHPKRRLHPALTALSIFAAMLVIAYLVGRSIGTIRSDDTQTSPAEPTAVDPESTAAAPEPSFELVEGELPIGGSEMNELVVFVEQTTGREFRRKPKIAIQSVASFTKVVEEQQEEALSKQPYSEKELQEIQARYLQTIGHTDLSQTDLVANQEAVNLTEVIPGFYAPVTDTVHIPKEESDLVTFESLLVHELTHALDDQYVDIQAALDHIEPDSDTGFGVRAVIEGRATAVQQAWDAQTPSPTPDSELPEGIPASVILEPLLAYQFGTQLVQSVGGPANSWDLYENFPASSEQAMFPARYPEDPPIDVLAPPLTGPVSADAPISEGSFGAVDLVTWLALDSFPTDQTKLQSALLAADGFGGGSQVLWGDDANSCIRVDIAADNQTDAQEIRAAFDLWSQAAPSGTTRTMEGSDTKLSVLACSPYRR